MKNYRFNFDINHIVPGILGVTAAAFVLAGGAKFYQRFSKEAQSLTNSKKTETANVLRIKYEAYNPVNYLNNTNQTQEGRN
jgi:hypothetical protein